MAIKFTAGMKNVVEVLNQMWDAFAAGPYNGLPLTGGTLTGPVTSTSTISAKTIRSDRLTAGYDGAALQSVLARYNTPEGTELLTLAYCADFYVAAGSPGNAAATVLNLIRNNVTGRSISVGGTFNAGGADYAEYLIKALLCGTIVPGQIVGIDAAGQLTDKWTSSIAFMVKSTNPCMVGGDSWAQGLGARPGVPQRGEDDTDDTWAVKESDHAAALVAFDVALEQRRKTVDRIAFAGQVPVNVQGATPGQYIVPVQDSEGIAGAAMHLADMSMAQYANAVGKVIAIEGDGRARIIVKVA